MTLAPLVAALLAGLAGSPHCVGMCGPFAAAASRETSSGVAWHVGRLVTYASLGILAGTLGEALPAGTWIARGVATVLLVGFAARLAGLLPEVHLSHLPGLRGALGWAAKRRGPLGGFLFGGLSGLMPCGLVYAALAVPVASADPLVGGLSMIAFGLGTIPLLAMLSGAAQKLMAHSKWARYAVAALVLVSGLSAIAHREPPPPNEAPACH